MNTHSLTRAALLGSACVALVMIFAGPAEAQTFAPGTNCQSLIANLRTACVAQARQLNSGTGISNDTVIPNSAGSNTVPMPGTLNTGTDVAPTGVAPTGVSPNGTTLPNSVTTNGVAGPNGVLSPNGTTLPNSVPTPNEVISPNAVTPNGTMLPNSVTPNTTINPNAVITPNSAAPGGNPVIVPPAGGAGSGTSGN